MELVDFLKYRASNGIGVLADFHALASASSPEEVAALSGDRLAQVKKYLRAWENFKHPSIQTAAKESQLSLTVLVDLSSVVYPLRNHKNRVSLIIKLCQMLAGLGADHAKAVAVETVSNWIGDTTGRLDAACLHATVGKDGKRRLTAALSAPLAARIDTVLHRLAGKIMREKTELDYFQAYAAALTQKLLSPSTGEPEQFGPMFMIATDCHFHADGKISTTDGALVNIQDVVDQELAPTGWAAVMGTTDDTVYPMVGALVKVHNRFASTPQRLVAIMETLVCTWPGCDKSAAKCQAHHITAVKHGGQTTTTNLTMLCKYHNGRNDDDVERHRNGRMERHPETGKLGLRRHPGQPLQFNSHPITSKTTTSYSQDS